MARLRFLTRLKRAWLASKKRSIAGFTLIELLVSMLIAAIITVSLLSLVVGLVDVNQRDAEQTEVQQSMQAAMDYVSQELRESVFVYDAQCLAGQGNIGGTAPGSADCPGLVNHIPATLKDNIALAFWRTSLLPEDVLKTCSDYSTGGPDDAGGTTAPRLTSEDVKNGGYAVKSIPCIAGRGYTLVVYTLEKRLETDTIWRGKARLKRYQLTQFNESGGKVNGYVDPLGSAEIGDLRFLHWPYQKATDTSALTNSQAGVLPDDTSAVLVDFLDDTEKTPAATDCPAPTHLTYNSNLTSFRACVRGRTATIAGLTGAALEAQDAEQDVKQEIVVTLTGKIPDRPKAVIALGSPADKKLAPLQTRVLSRTILR